MDAYPYYDRLYGALEFTPEDYRLFRTPEMIRLHDISLSAVPPWLLPAAEGPSRFEHALGVAHLARLVSSGWRFTEPGRDLFFAALFHDCMSPPFSHLPEYFMEKHLGVNHEENAAAHLDATSIGKEIQRQDGDLKRIATLIVGGDTPYDCLINGRNGLDLDNADNTLRYSLGMGLIHDLHYSPERLVRGLLMHDNALHLKAEAYDDLKGWAECRRVTYQFVYSISNLVASSMLFRAIGFANECSPLRRAFFSMTDHEAFVFLENHRDPRTRALLRRLKRWEFYWQAWSYETDQPSEAMRIASSDAGSRLVLADRLAEVLKIEPRHVCVYLGRNKGFKNPGERLRLLDSNGVSSPMDMRASRQTYGLRVFINPRCVLTHSASKTAAALTEWLDLTDPGSASEAFL